MSISLELWQFLFTKDVTKNPEIENTPVLRLSNLKRQGRVSDIEFDEKFFDAAKCFVVVFLYQRKLLDAPKKKKKNAAKC